MYSIVYTFFRPRLSATLRGRSPGQHPGAAKAPWPQQTNNTYIHICVCIHT